MSDEIAHDFSPFIKFYKDGRVERLKGNDIVPPSLDLKTGVESTDIVVSAETGLSARLYIPKTAINTSQKLPLLVYFHGGGFCIETAFSPTYHDYLNSLAASANIVVVSVDYRRAPEHPLPIAYDDSWAVLKWISSHFEQKGPSEWLNSNADLKRVFFAGDSAGANIAHNMAMRVGLSEEELRIKLVGSVLVHPYFGGKEPIGAEVKMEAGFKAWTESFWRLACPSTTGLDDPLINPAEDPNLEKLGGEKLLVCVAEKDFLRERGWYYSELVRKRGWGGIVEVLEAKEENHVFHLFNPSCENAIAMLKRISSFIS
ncbi:probable carboxylesterase 12 [Ziziphus jujuba]|uniref:Probable carboxylesterase 12 n=1 Tax=Ziziphus jujuba TaxID=326968 RepID=A0A6P3ZAD8_ZIZJJ|nr:probable carboxylesterase 12 [Ziziphus jujuba]